MGKRKTPVFRQGKDQNTTPKDNGKVKAIRTWDDVEHDSEDDCKRFMSIFLPLIS